MEVYGKSHAPAALAMGRTLYPFYGRLGGPQDQSGRVRQILPPPGFDPRTVQPIESRYTDWAIPAPKLNGVGSKEHELNLKMEYRWDNSDVETKRESHMEYSGIELVPLRKEVWEQLPATLHGCTAC